MSDQPLHVYTNTEFEGHYPVGTAAVVVAHDPAHAAALLQDALAEHGLHGAVDPDDFEQMDLERAAAKVLVDGNY